MREGLGELEGEAEPRRAKRAARSSDAEGGLMGAVEELKGALEKLTLDFLRALSRARRASSWSGGDIV